MKKFLRISPVDGMGGFGSGFFSNYRIIINDLVIHNRTKNELIPYIDWGDTAWVEGYNPFIDTNLIKNGNPFDLWFEQIIPNENDIVYEHDLFGRHTIVNHSIDYFNDKTQLNEQKMVDEKFLKLKKHIINKIDLIYEKEFKNEIVLGVIARGCEHNYHHPNYGIYSINDYITEIKNILNKNPEITKLFLVSEDSNYINILKEEFPKSYFISDIFRRTNETIEYMNSVYLWPNVDRKRVNQNELLGEETIIQTKLLGKCDYLFGKHSGVFCGGILWGEKIKKICKI